MGSWSRKRGKQVVVFVYQDGISKQLPRDLTRHLDGQPAHNIEYWIGQYEVSHGLVATTQSDPGLTRFVEQYLAYQKSRGRASGTVAEHKRHLLQHVIPFFLGNDLMDPNQWPSVSIKMLNELKNLTPHQIFRCNVALRQFYKWLSEERLILGNGDIPLRNPILEKKTTPLKSTMTPESVLDLYRGTADADFKLVLLAGYFFSLRPQEIFALNTQNFSGGSSILILECSKAMKQIGLYDRFAVKITRQRDKLGVISTPKSKSQGWVSCFHKEAATEIVELVKKRSGEEFVLAMSPVALYKHWPFEFAIKDLRRASLYWLRHETGISQNQLMKHARHQSYETTLIYLRRPEEEVVGGQLDLDA